ncbi:MAG: hypothetical protein SPL30_05050 [Succinivibrio sp.]|jgi:fumarate reductase subunit C|nr:hypothetical protein [Succinivibrio sp.]
MAQATSFRKPYHREVTATWWTKNPFYVHYMLREGTAVLALFATLEIILGVFLFAMCNLNAVAAGTVDETTTAAYMWWATDFLGNPVVIALNIVTLGAQLFHMVTWFNLMPKAVRVFLNKNSTERLPDIATKLALYAAALGGFIVVLGAAWLTK